MSTSATGPQPGRFEDPNDPYRFGRPETPVGTAGWGPPPDPYARTDHRHGQGPAAPSVQSASRKSVAALVLGILSIFLFFLTFIDLVLIVPAIVLASLALNDAKQRNGAGRGLAIAGLCCAIAGAVAAITFTVWAMPKVAKCANEYPTNSVGYRSCVQDIVK